MAYVIKNIKNDLYYQKTNLNKELIFAKNDPFIFKYKNDAKELIEILKDTDLQIIKR